MKLTTEQIRQIIKEELAEMMASPQLSSRDQKTLDRAKRIADTFAYQQEIPARLMQDLRGSAGAMVGDLEDLANALQLGFFGDPEGMEVLQQHGIDGDEMANFLRMAHKSSSESYE